MHGVTCAFLTPAAYTVHANSLGSVRVNPAGAVTCVTPVSIPGRELGEGPRV